MAPFQPGNTFGKGRPKGSRNLSTLVRDHLRHDAPERAATIIELALDKRTMEGVRALRQLSPRPTGETVEIELPEISKVADVMVAQNMVMQATARGELDTDRAQELMRMLDSQRETIMAVDIEQRLEKLEEFAAESEAIKKSLKEATKR